MMQIDKYVEKSTATIRVAIKKMDLGGIGFLAISDKNKKIIGIITDGDFRRAVLKGIDLNQNVLVIANKTFQYIEKDYHLDEALKYFSGKCAIEYLPVIENGILVDIISKDDLFQKELIEDSNKQKIKLPVIIMAGGKGKRLDPFTRVWPKSLIPIGEKPIIELIMDEFSKNSLTEFYISINNNDKMLRAFFADHKTYNKIKYIKENKPLGTAGALRLLEGKIKGNIFVTNCDIIIKVDYNTIIQFHKKNNNDLTLIGSIHHKMIPYGVCEIDDKGMLLNINEKPEYDFLVNTGLYLLKTSMLKQIPKNKYFDMTTLIQKALSNKKKIGVYPVSEKSWFDTGEWQEYKKTISSLNNDVRSEKNNE